MSFESSADHDPHLDAAFAVPIVLAAERMISTFPTSSADDSPEPDIFRDDRKLRATMADRQPGVIEARAKVRQAYEAAVRALAHLSEAIEDYHNEVQHAEDEASRVIISMNKQATTLTPESITGIS